METMTIADSVEELRSALEWSDEANALGDVEYNYDDDDMRGQLTMGSIEVTWVRDMYGDGNDDWVATQVSYDGIPMEDQDDYPELDDAVKAAAHRTDAWQKYRADELSDEIIAWLESQGEAYDVLGPQDDEPGDAWTISWGDVTVRGYYDEDGAFVWSVLNSESVDYLDGDADSDPDDVIEAIERCATDPMVEAWVETVAVKTAEDDWFVRSSEDQMTVYMHSSIAYGLSRRAYYVPTGYEEGRIELDYRVRGSEWRPFDEYLPEDEEDVRRMAGKAYAWVKAVDA